MDYNEYGGAPLWALQSRYSKAHGSAKAKTFKNALRLTAAYVAGDVIGEVSSAVKQLGVQEAEE